jgi:uncharacterized protein DUF6894
MQRYFFDLGNQSGSMYDYQGREVATPEAAYELAELMALDLGLDESWVGWVLVVRSPEGKSFFSIPVQNADLACR